MPRNESPENTIMRDVLPGEETGIYYIIISGLPFATIWQLLKDWLRQAGCDVDHVEVFQKSTSGWVRLIGKENFERALHHLQTVPYNNRLLLYLDKNRTEPVKIMELLDDPPPMPKLGGSSRAARQRNRSRAHPHTAPRGQDKGCAQTAPCNKHLAGPSPSSPALELPFAASYRGTLATDSWKAHNTPREGCGPLAKGGRKLQHASGHRLSEQPASPRREAEASSGHHLCHDGAGGVHFTPLSRMRSTTGQAIQLGKGECFNVQIMCLRQWASPRDVEEWVRHIMGEWAPAVSYIDVPPGHQKGCIRGSGYVTFLSSVAAKRAVELLHQKPFLGRVVCARLVDEGKGVMDRGEQGSHDDGRQSSPTGRPMNSHRDAASTPCDARAKADAKHAPPVIAHGTLYRPK